MQVILSTAYLPPIEFFHLLKMNPKIYLEKYETYPKQTYRNRCVILTANGPLSLSIPVVKPFGNKTLTKDIRIDNSVKWRLEHWRAIESGYKSSAFFEFLSDYLHPFFCKEHTFLWDYNFEIIKTIIEILEIQVEICETEVYTKTNQSIIDYRIALTPKMKSFDNKPQYVNKPYFQVFGAKYGFVPNLSILDLLCNCGMDSVLYLS
jgi:hypothetical protein